MNARMPAWSISGGLASLGVEATALLRSLDDTFTGWGTAAGAEQMMLPPLTRVDALHPLDYFHSFPHLGSVVSRIRTDRLDDYSQAVAVDAILASDMVNASYLLPSAACYSVYLHLHGVVLDEPAVITTMARCFRNEDHYDGLRRLWGFSMREIVCVGSAGAVRHHLERHHGILAAFLGRLGVGFDRQVATDPFFKKNDPRAFLQKIDPVKEEYVVADGTAIASMNYHRNFFGERCHMTYAGRPAFTGCVAFGLERWVHVLAEGFGGDLGAAREAVLAAGEPE
jgi:seryl-tRNA synthetase